MKKLGILGLTLLMTICMLFASACGRVEFKVNFIVDGQVYATIKTTGEEVIRMPNDPEKEEYVFDGWYWDEGSWQKPFTANSLLDAPLSSNMAVYAKWRNLNSLTGAQAEFNMFEQIGEYEYSLAVSNSTEALSIAPYVEIGPRSSWTLCSDISGNNTIASRTATLEIGNNTYYVLVIAEDGMSQLYTLRIRRKPMYVVAFDTVGGTSVDAQQVEEGALAVAPQTTKEGYDFCAWNYDFSNPITENKTIVATWTAKQYTITYNPEGGEVENDTTTVFYDSGFVLETPTRTGYDFLGWYLGSDKVENGTWQTTSSITLVAHWSLSEYSISYTLNGGYISGDNPTAYTINSDEIVLINPIREGFEFAGWTGTEISEPTMMVVIPSGSVGNRQYVANWIGDGYNITYHLNGGENHTDNPNEYNVDSANIYLEEPSRFGYEFDGWFTSESFSSGSRIEVISTGTMGDIHLYAKWTAKTVTVSLDHTDIGSSFHTVSFNLNGASGTAPASQMITSISGLTYPSLPTRSGYIFAGWYANSSCTGNPYDFTAEVTEDITLYAKWIYPSSYTSILTIGGDTGSTSFSSTIKYYPFVSLVNQTITIYTSHTSGDPKIYLYDASKSQLTYNDDGYSNNDSLITYTVTAGTLYYAGFGCWGSSSGIGYMYITGTSIPSAGGLANGTFFETEQLTYGEYFTLDVPTIAGSTFLGWYDGVGGTGIQYTDETGASVRVWDKDEDAILYAKWDVVGCTIIFDKQGGSGGSNSVNATYGLAMPLATAPIKVGYEFTGYYTAISGGTKYYNADMTSANTWDGTLDTTLYAQWTAKTVTATLDQADTDGSSYTVSFNLNGASGSVLAQTVTATEGLTYPTVPTRTGYAFAGWYATASCTGIPYDFTADVTEDITLYAKWVSMNSAYTSREYVDIANYNNTSSKKTFSVTATSSSSPNYYYFTCYNAGTYTFNGAFSSGDYYICVYNMTKSSTIVSNTNWWSSGNKSTATSFTASAGDVIYVRLYKYSNSDSTGSGTFYVTNANYPTAGGLASGTSYVTEQLTYGQNFSLAVPTRTGYTFLGWYDGVGGTGTQYTDETGASVRVWDKEEDTTLYAKWIEIENQTIVTVTLNDLSTDSASRTVSFNLNGASGTAPTSQTITEAIGLTYPSLPTRSGYVFAGWYANSSCSGNPYDFTAEVTEDITLYAKWLSHSMTATAIKYGNNTINIIGGDTDQYFAFVALTTGTITINVGKNAWIGANTSALESGSHDYDSITYSVTSGQLYYIHLESHYCSSSAEYIGTTYLNITGNITPSAGGIATGTSLVTEQLTCGEFFTLGVPTRTGYTFLGWYDGVGGTGTQYTDAIGASIRVWDKDVDTTLYAKWIEIIDPTMVTVTLNDLSTDSVSRTVSFNLNGASGTAPAPQTITQTSGLTYPTIPNRSEYLFAGWYTNSSCTGSPFDFTAEVTEDITLYAKWISYSGYGTLRVDGNSGSVTFPARNSSNYRYYAFVPLVSGNITIYSSSSSDTYGYLFNSSKSQLTYDDDSGSSTNFSITYTVTAGQLYYVVACAYSSSSSCTGTIYITGTSTPMAGGLASETFFETEQLTCGEFFTLSVPTRTGYTFLGWYDGVGGTGTQYTDATGASVRVWDKDEDTTLYAKWNFVGVTTPTLNAWDGTVATSFASGNGTEYNPYIIETGAQLAYLASRVNAGNSYSGYYFRLNNDIDLNNINWTPIGIGSVTDGTNYIEEAFSGHFNGNGKQIINLTVNNTTNKRAGLFGALYGAEVANLAVVNANVAVTQSHIVSGGILAGTMYSTTISQCFVSGTVLVVDTALESSLSASAGAIAGITAGEGCTIENCSAQADVTGRMTNHWNTYVGGIVGNAKANITINKTIFKGTLYAFGYNEGYAGGLLGIGSATIRNCVAIATISDATKYDAISPGWSGSLPTVYNTYYNSNVSSSLATSVSVSNFKSESWLSSTLSWDFTNVWTFVDGSDYPVLRVFN